jgi:hypothetical protein
MSRNKKKDNDKELGENRKSLTKNSQHPNRHQSDDHHWKHHQQ